MLDDLGYSAPPLFFFFRSHFYSWILLGHCRQQ
jgi:hypothetical protein